MGKGVDVEPGANRVVSDHRDGAGVGELGDRWQVNALQQRVAGEFHH